MIFFNGADWNYLTDKVTNFQWTHVASLKAANGEPNTLSGVFHCNRTLLFLDTVLEPYVILVIKNIYFYWCSLMQILGDGGTSLTPCEVDYYEYSNRWVSNDTFNLSFPSIGFWLWNCVNIWIRKVTFEKIILIVKLCVYNDVACKMNVRSWVPPKLPIGFVLDLQL